MIKDERYTEAINLMEKYLDVLEDLDILNADVESINPMDLFHHDIENVGLVMAIIKIRNFIREQKESRPTFKRFKKAEAHFYEIFSDKDKWVELWI